MEENFKLWTDEKHSSYLKSIEASFVDQLHESLDRYMANNQGRWSKLESWTWRDQVFMQSNGGAEFTDQNFHDEVECSTPKKNNKIQKKKNKSSSSKFSN